jgi:hypothetical protein
MVHNPSPARPRQVLLHLLLLLLLDECCNDFAAQWGAYRSLKSRKKMKWDNIHRLHRQHWLDAYQGCFHVLICLVACQAFAQNFINVQSNTNGSSVTFKWHSCSFSFINSSIWQLVDGREPTHLPAHSRMSSKLDALRCSWLLLLAWLVSTYQASCSTTQLLNVLFLCAASVSVAGDWSLLCWHSSGVLNMQSRATETCRCDPQCS